MLSSILPLDTILQCRSTPLLLLIDTSLICFRRTEPELSTTVSCRVSQTPTSTRGIDKLRSAPFILHSHPIKLRYSPSPLKPPDFINKTLKFCKTVSRLSKQRVSCQAFVYSFDDCLRKRSIQPCMSPTLLMFLTSFIVLSRQQLIHHHG